MNDDSDHGRDEDGERHDRDDEDGHEGDGGGADGHDREHSAGDHDHGADEHDHDHGTDDHDHDHHHHHDVESVGVAVVTVSSSRSLDDDPAGDAIVATFEADGHEVVVRNLVADDYDGIQGEVESLVGRKDVETVVTTGGTGVTPDDVTVEATESLFEKELPGFGELFRQLSYDEIGTRVVGTRAIAGVTDGVPVFCLPGSENAARLGSEEVIVPQIGHLVGLARQDEEE